MINITNKQRNETTSDIFANHFVKDFGGGSNIKFLAALAYLKILYILKFDDCVIFIESI